MFKITKGINNKCILSLRDMYGKQAIAKIATPEELIEALTEAREWVEKFYKGDKKVEALKDLTPTVLKYRNGAVVHALEEDTSYWFVTSDFDLINTRYDEGFSETDIKRLQNKSVFLSKEEAKAYVEKVKIYNKLEKQITIINHENGWVEDWNNTEKKYYLNINHINNVYYYSCCLRHQKGGYPMSKEAIDWLLSDEVSDNERKIWIEGL